MTKPQKTAIKGYITVVNALSKSAEKLRAEIEKKSIELHTRAFGRMESDPEEEINPLNRSSEILLRMADELEEVKSYLNESVGITPSDRNQV